MTHIYSELQVINQNILLKISALTNLEKTKSLLTTCQEILIFTCHKMILENTSNSATEAAPAGNYKLHCDSHIIPSIPIKVPPRFITKTLSHSSLNFIVHFIIDHYYHFHYFHTRRTSSGTRNCCLWCITALL